MLVDKSGCNCIAVTFSYYFFLTAHNLKNETAFRTWMCAYALLHLVAVVKAPRFIPPRIIRGNVSFFPGCIVCVSRRNDNVSGRPHTHTHTHTHISSSTSLSNPFPRPKRCREDENLNKQDQEGHCKGKDYAGLFSEETLSWYRLYVSMLSILNLEIKL